MIKTFLPNRVKRGIAALFAGAFLLAGCSMLDDAFPSEDDDVILTRATQATFDTSAYATDKDYMKMAVGETQGITVLLTPYNASTAPTWISSNDSIVKVEAGTLTCSSSQEYAQATATLTAIDTGIATITATVDGVTTSVTVKVGGTLPAAAEWSMTSAPSVTYNGVVSTLDTTGITPSDNTTPVYISSDSKSQTTLQFYSSLANSKGGISYKNNALYTGKNGSASVDTMAIRAAQYLVLNVASDNSTVSITAKPEAAALYRGMWFDDHQHTSSNDCTFDTWTNTSSTMSVYNTAEETTVTKTVNKGTYYIYINSVYISNITVSTEENLITLTPSATAALIGTDNAISLTVNPASAKVAITDGEDNATLTNNGSGSWTLTGKEAGEVEVTATADGYASSTNIFTFSLPVVSITANTAAEETLIGSSNAITLSATPANATLEISSGSDYATLASNGSGVWTLTGTDKGTVVVTGSAEKYTSSTSEYKFIYPDATASLLAETIFVTGDNNSTTLTVTPASATVTLSPNTYATAVKTSSDDSSAVYTITAKADCGISESADVTITVSADKYNSATTTLKVSPLAVELTASQEYVIAGETIEITSNVANATLSVSDESLATIAQDTSDSSKWILTGVAKGTVTITGSATGYTAGTISVTVKTPSIAWDFSSAPTYTVDGTSSTLTSTEVSTTGATIEATTGNLSLTYSLNTSNRGGFSYSGGAVNFSKKASASSNAVRAGGGYFALTVENDCTITIAGKGSAADFRFIALSDHERKNSATDCNISDLAVGTEATNVMGFVVNETTGTISASLTAGQTYYIYGNGYGISSINIYE